MSLMLALAVASAAPFDLVHQGRLVQSSGSPVDGVHDLTVTLSDGANATLGAPHQFDDVAVQDGFFAVRLTGLDSAWFSGTVRVAVAVDGVTMSGPTELASAPRAHVAARATVADRASGASTGAVTGACAEAGALRWDATASRLKVCNGHLWTSLGGGDLTVVDGARRWADGTTATSCETYLRPTDGLHVYDGATGDGVYWIDPDGTGTIAAVPLFCDMTRHGGGWTLIGKVGAGRFDGMSNAQYIALYANDIAHVNPAVLQGAEAPEGGQIAFLDKPFTNALYAAVPYKVARIDFTQTTASASSPSGPYFQRKITSPGTLDFWAAMRDSRLWGTGVSGDGVTGFGTAFKLAYGETVWNEGTHDFAHAGDTHFGWWDSTAITLPSGATFNPSRHMGLICDGHGSLGAGWMMTSNPSTGGYKNDTGHNMKSVIWLR
jgi:hypothetical protein